MGGRAAADAAGFAHPRRMQSRAFERIIMTMTSTTRVPVALLANLRATHGRHPRAASLSAQ